MKCNTPCLLNDLIIPLDSIGASLVAQKVKRLPAIQEIWVQSQNQENPLKNGVAIYSSITAWRIPWTEEPGGLQSMELQRD